MIVSDLDGTLLDGEGKVHREDYSTLENLGRVGHIRVLATGRSLFSLRRAVADDFPVDYVILSGGTGIMDWRSKKILIQHSIGRNELEPVVDLLKSAQVDFMLHRPLPDNHYFFYLKNGAPNADFDKRLQLYSGYGEPLRTVPESASQIVTIFPPGEHLPETVVQQLGAFHLVRATSPIDYHSTWYEIHHPDSTKSNGAAWLASALGLSQEQTIALGNDYNDLDLLEWAGQAFVVANAPPQLKRKFACTNDFNRAPLTDLAQRTGLLKREDL